MEPNRRLFHNWLGIYYISVIYSTQETMQFYVTVEPNKKERDGHGLRHKLVLHVNCKFNYSTTSYVYMDVL